jgi:anti-sigma factor (TIGR02949 family)
MTTPATSGEHGAACAELRRRLSEFVDRELPEAVCQAFRDHAAACPACEALCAGVATVIALCRELPRAPVPEDARRRLRAALDAAGGRA